jgi:circadian clock protein KaiB
MIRRTGADERKKWRRNAISWQVFEKRIFSSKEFREVEGVAALRDDCFSFILYTAGNLPNSVQAVSNLRAMCLAHFPNHHRIEIVDLLQNPQRGPVDGIIVTPTLVKTAPEPKQTIMGDLSDIPRRLHAISWTGKRGNQSVAFLAAGP